MPIITKETLDRLSVEQILNLLKQEKAQALRSHTVIDPLADQLVQELVTLYPIVESLSKGEEISTKLQELEVNIQDGTNTRPLSKLFAALVKDKQAALLDIDSYNFKNLNQVLSAIQAEGFSKNIITYANIYKIIGYLHKTTITNSDAASEDFLSSALQLLYKNIVNEFDLAIKNGNPAISSLAEKYILLPEELRKHVAQSYIQYKGKISVANDFTQAVQKECIDLRTELQGDFEQLLSKSNDLEDKNISATARSMLENEIHSLVKKLKSFNALDMIGKNGFSLLLHAVAAQNQELLNELLQNGADPNSKISINKKSTSILEYALNELDDKLKSKDLKDLALSIEVVASLISGGVNILSPGMLERIKSYNIQALNEICNEHQDVRALAELIGMINSWNIIDIIDRQKFNINKYVNVINSSLVNGETPLMVAIKSKNMEVLGYLLKLIKYIEPNARDLEGNTILHLAAKTDDDKIFKIVSKYLASVNIPILYHARNNEAKTALEIAFKNKNNKIYEAIYTTSTSTFALRGVNALLADDSPHKEMLIEKWVQVLESKKNEEQFIKDVINYKEPQNNIDILSASLIAGATKLSDILLVRLDLYDGIQESIKIPLITAIKMGNKAVVSKILGQGIDPNFQFDDITPLMVAANTGNQDMVKFLISNGANINFRTSCNFDALYDAAMNGHVTVCKILLDLGAEPSVVSRYGDTPLSIALTCARHNVVNLLSNSKLQDYGYTTLMTSIVNSKFLDAEKLIDDKNYISKEINSVNAGGHTALMIAAQKYAELAKLGVVNDPQLNTLFRLMISLIEKGAKVDFQNKIGINFLAIASVEPALVFDDDVKLKLLLKTINNQEVIKTNEGQNIFHLCIKYAPELLPRILLVETKENIVRYLNATDDANNSPLSYLMTSFDPNINLDLVSMLVDDYGAKFIRNGHEIRTGLHLKVLLADVPDDLGLAIIKDKALINKQDEDGLTALHYACMHQKYENAQRLVDLGGADFKIKDNLGRTPVHYMAANDFMLENVPFDSLLEEDKFGISPIILAFQHNSNSIIKENISFLQKRPANIKGVTGYALSNIADFMKLKVNDLNALKVKAFKDMLDKIVEAPGHKLDYRKKLILLSTLRHALKNPSINLAKLNNADVDVQIDAAAKQIIHSEFSNPEKYPVFMFDKNMAIGLEQEIPELPKIGIMPISDFAAWFPTIFVEDHSVMRSILTLQPKNEQEEEKLEAVSHIIRNSEEYNSYLAMCGMFAESGAKVNKSAGAHIHVNCRGSTTASPPLPALFDQKDPKRHEKELTYVKFLLINYISIEQLLRGFMRNGTLFDEYGGAYVDTISKYRQDILACNNLKELQDKYCTHTKTIDLTALDKHGTIEFRSHEGAIDPVLINAWAECVTRLTAISFEQAQAYHNPASKLAKVIEPKVGIEQLVYLLIAQRNYMETWDKKWGAPVSANVQTTTAYPGNNTLSAQEQIQQSPFYKIMAVVLDYMDKNHTDGKGLKSVSVTGFERKVIGSFTKDDANGKSPVKNTTEFESYKSTLNEVCLMLDFMRDNPGVILHRIDQTAGRHEMYSALKTAVNNVSKLFGEDLPVVRKL